MIKLIACITFMAIFIYDKQLLPSLYAFMVVGDCVIDMITDKIKKDIDNVKSDIHKERVRFAYSKDEFIDNPSDEQFENIKGHKPNN